MGKLKHLASVKSAKSESFVYTPPLAAFDATRILVKVDMAYPTEPPISVSGHVLGAVLRGLRRANPNARILVIEGAWSDESVQEVFRRAGLMELLDDNMRSADAEELLMMEYPNLLENPVKFKTMTAPGYIREYDCCISVSAFREMRFNNAPFISASLKNLYGLFPREPYALEYPHTRGKLYQPGISEVIQDVYFTIGHHFHGSVIDLTGKFISQPAPDGEPVTGEIVPVGQVVWGDDLLAVDEAACRLAGEAPAGYLGTIRALREAITQNSNER